MVDKNCKLILFGASNMGESACNFIGKENVHAFCDNDQKKWGRKLNNINILNPAELINIKDIKVIITSSYTEEIIKQLLEIGINNFECFDYEKNVQIYNDRKYFKESYSQEGEDMILENIFKNKNRGIYIDIGAHHPKRFSNTYYFYKLGWRGINIEPNPGSKKLFDNIRPRDINIEIGISKETKYIDYYMFNEPALNSFNNTLSEERIKDTNYKLNDIKIVKTIRLDELLDKYLDNRNIDFLNIDVEGFEIEVLESNNWEKYRPEYVLIEELDNLSKNNKKISDILNDVGYKKILSTTRTSFYKTY